MPIGDKIKFLRKAMGLNQTELGKRLGVKTNAVSKWECGRVEDIPMSKVKAMAVLFGVPVSYLVDENLQQPLSAPSNANDPSNRVFNFEITLDHYPEFDKAVFQKYFELSADDRETVQQMVHVMHDRRKKENPPQD